jgi:Fic family protein
MRNPMKLKPLPPTNIDYGKLIKPLGEAQRHLGELNGALILPSLNPSLLVTPFLTKEAVSSSRIEGTQVTFDQVVNADADEVFISENTVSNLDILETVNYRKALLSAAGALERRPISENLIKEAHAVLLSSVRGSEKNPGNFRTTQVHIGKPGTSIDQALYIPPPPGDILSLFNNWEQYINSDTERDPLIQIAVAHYQFEAIHPFIDGNGRVGRMLIPLFLIANKLLQHPVLYISEYFERYRDQYEHLLRHVDQTQDFNPWIDYFLTGVSMQALKAQTKIYKISTLYSEYRAQVETMQLRYGLPVLEAFFRSPVLTAGRLKFYVPNASSQTLHNTISKFVERGLILKGKSRKRNALYGMQNLIDLLKVDQD